MTSKNKEEGKYLGRFYGSLKGLPDGLEFQRSVREEWNSKAVLKKILKKYKKAIKFSKCVPIYRVQGARYKRWELRTTADGNVSKLHHNEGDAWKRQ